MEMEKQYIKIQKELEKRLGIKMNIPNKKLILSLEDNLRKIYEYGEDLGDHCIAVSIIGAYIGHCLDLIPDEIDELFIAGALHDIGKLFIPKQIIDKPGSLDEDERKIIESHPAYSIWYLTSGTDEEKPQYYSHKILDMIRYHHEEVSGHGYPYGLKRSQINAGAKILAIADKFEAYGAKRSYHEARTLSECISFLERQADKSIIDKNITAEVVFILKQYVK